MRLEMLKIACAAGSAHSVVPVTVSTERHCAARTSTLRGRVSGASGTVAVLFSRATSWADRRVRRLADTKRNLLVASPPHDGHILLAVRFGISIRASVIINCEIINYY